MFMVNSVHISSDCQWTYDRNGQYHPYSLGGVKIFSILVKKSLIQKIKWSVA